jgi:hypothetical protein
MTSPRNLQSILDTLLDIWTPTSVPREKFNFGIQVLIPDEFVFPDSPRNFMSGNPRQIRRQSSKHIHSIVAGMSRDLLIKPFGGSRCQSDVKKS